MNEAGRPGEGGRRPSIDRGFLTDATRELREELGPPNIAKHRGAWIEWWETDVEGDGALIARLSTRDAKQGETVFGQLHPLRAMAKRLELRPRWLLAGLKIEVKHRYDQRLDFQFVEHQLEADAIKWVAYRGVDRIARAALASETFYDRLRSTSTDLYLCELGGLVDWDRDALHLQVRSMLAEHERRQINSRTQYGLRHQYPLAGRGWPGCGRFGFKRDEYGFFVVDPVQWPFIERIHYDYAELCDERGTGGISKLQRHLAAQGCHFSRDRVRTILKDPIYVTGEWSVTYAGEVIPQRPIHLDRPIPISVFEHNQRVLDLNRQLGSGAVGHGKNLLGGFPVWHSACRGETHQGKAIRLAVHVDPGTRKRRFYHWPATPGRCRSWGVPAEPIERAVVRHLLALVASPELQTEWAIQTTWENLGVAPPAESEIELLEIQTRNLNRQRERMVRTWLDGAAQNAHGDATEAYQRATRTIDREILAIERRLALARETIAARAREATDRRSDAELVERMRAVLELREDSPRMRRSRALLVRSLLSGVVIHNAEEGVGIQLHGPLIEADSDHIEVIDLRERARGALGAPTASELPAKLLLSSQIRTRPAWASPVIGVVVPRLRRPPCPDLDGAFRKLDAYLPPGRFSSRDLQARWSALYNQGLLPSVASVKRAEWLSRESRETLVRRALGAERAIRNGRCCPRTCDELAVALLRASRDGLSLDLPGLPTRMNAASRTLSYLPCMTHVHRVLRSEGWTLAQLVDAVRSLNGSGGP